MLALHSLSSRLNSTTRVIMEDKSVGQVLHYEISDNKSNFLCVKILIANSALPYRLVAFNFLSSKMPLCSYNKLSIEIEFELYAFLTKSCSRNTEIHFPPQGIEKAKSESSR